MLLIQMPLCTHYLVDVTEIGMGLTVTGILTDLRKINSRQEQNTSKIGDILHAEMLIQN